MNMIPAVLVILGLGWIIERTYKIMASIQEIKDSLTKLEADIAAKITPAGSVPVAQTDLDEIAGQVAAIESKVA